jgi:peptidoglycan/LPS O-acetylase OafA/YrhL
LRALFNPNADCGLTQAGILRGVEQVSFRVPNSNYRPDIDGLRAVAISLVVVFHVQEDLIPGGFVGVDVFFAISGFLITGIISDALERGTFSLAGFYERRIRRIFPALIVVLAAVWILGWYTLLPEDFAGLGRQIVAGAAFASNLLTYSEVGYFDAAAASKPLLHLWSLGVEEQFYLAMPLLLMIAMKRRSSVPWVLALGAALSFAGSIILVRYSQPAAFYLPFTRVWELLVGGYLAYAASHWPSWTIKLQREAVSVAGIVLIAAAACLSPAAAFPGWWAVPPVLGSILIIAAGPGTLVNRALSCRPAVALGLISYPLYLWHWPLLVLLRDPNSKGRWIVALSVVLAAATYLLIERPLRSFRLPRVAVTSFAAMVVAALLGVAAVLTDGLPSRYSPPIPSLFLRVPRPPYGPNGYESGNLAGPKILTWGDSHADQLIPGLLAVRDVQPIRLYHASFGGGCAPIRVQPETRDCADLLDSIKNNVAATQPDIIIIGALWAIYTPFNVGGLADLLEFSRKIGVRHTFVVGPEPRWPQPLRNELINAYLKNRQNGVPQRLNTYLRIDPEIERSIRSTAESHGAGYVSAMKTLCNSEGCLVRVGDNPGDILVWDDNHFSKAGSEYFVNQIIGQILASYTAR